MLAGCCLPLPSVVPVICRRDTTALLTGCCLAHYLPRLPLAVRGLRACLVPPCGFRMDALYGSPHVLLRGLRAFCSVPRRIHTLAVDACKRAVAAVLARVYLACCALYLPCRTLFPVPGSLPPIYLLPVCWFRDTSAATTRVPRFFERWNPSRLLLTATGCTFTVPCPLNRGDKNYLYFHLPTSSLCGCAHPHAVALHTVRARHDMFGSRYRTQHTYSSRGMTPAGV